MESKPLEGIGLGYGCTDALATSRSDAFHRQGLMERDTGNIFLTQEAVDASEKVRPGTGREAALGHEDPANQLLGSSVTYRIAVGPQQGRKVFA